MSSTTSSLEWARQLSAHVDQLTATNKMLIESLVKAREQRDRLFNAAQFLLAMNATNYDRDAMRGEGGFDELQKAVDFTIEQARSNPATTTQPERGRRRGRWGDLF